MNVVPYTVTVDRRAEWQSKVEPWRREEVRSQQLRQSAATVAGRRADPPPTFTYDAAPPTDDDMAEAFNLKYGIAHG